MSETSFQYAQEGDLKMDAEIANRFDRLDDTHGKMFDLLRDQAEKFNQHRVESTQFRTAFDARIANLEGTVERRSALKSGSIMAGIGALAGAVAAAIGKKTGLW